MCVLFIIVVIILVLFIVLLLIGIYQKNTNQICTSRKRLDGRTVLVTGGTAGMGLEMARDFAHRGARVIIASPFQSEGTHAVQEITQDSTNLEVIFRSLDLASFESTRNFAAHIINNEGRLDILINNAGVGGPTTAVSRNGLNFVLQVNYYGAFLLTLLLLPLLKKTGRSGEPSRIVNVSSASYIFGRAYIEDTKLCLLPPVSYIISKFYIVIFSRKLAKRLKDSYVVVNNADPGAVGTNIFFTFGNTPYLSTFVKFLFWILFKHPWQGAQTAIHVALDEKAGDVSGEYFKNCKQIKTHNIVCNDKLSMQLWNKSLLSVALSEKELNQLLCI